MHPIDFETFGGAGTEAGTLATRRHALRRWGWNDRLEAALAPRLEGLRDRGFGLEPARVLEVRRGSCLVVMEDGSGDAIEREAVLAGRFLRDGANEAGDTPELPATGDWALAAPPEGDGPAVLRALLPRASAFSRKAAGDTDHDRVTEQVLAANVDTAFIVCAAGHDWKLRRVERYLTLVWESGARPVVVVSKLDLSENPDELLAEAESVSVGAPVFGVCAPEGYGIERFAEFVAAGSTAVLLGSSGAGKSTIVNALAGKALRKVQDVRQDDHKGRHTTTARTLIRLDSGLLLVDTPGMRELQLWADDEALETAFGDIEDLARSCKFRDCSHGSEPGCAVREALESGELDAGRYASWRKLKRELAHLARREDPELARAERDRWKAINKSMRNFNRANKGLR